MRKFSYSALSSRFLRPLAILGLYLLIVWGYGYSALLADLGDWVWGPPILHEGLRAFIVVQIGQAFWKRWDDFTPGQRLGWFMVGVGIALNLARGHFSDTPLTFSYAAMNLGLLGLTWRLMAATRREVKLARSLHESEQIRLEQDQVIAEQQDDLKRVGEQSKEFEIRARKAEAHLASLGLLGKEDTHDHP